MAIAFVFTSRAHSYPGHYDASPPGGDRRVRQIAVLSTIIERASGAHILLKQSSFPSITLPLPTLLQLDVFRASVTLPRIVAVLISNTNPTLSARVTLPRTIDPMRERDTGE